MYAGIAPGVQHIYSQMDRQHQFSGCAKRKLKKYKLSGHSQGSTVRLKITACDYQKKYLGAPVRLTRSA